MDYDAMELTLERGCVLLGIGSHGVNRDVHIAAYDTILVIVKSDDVGVIIVLEELAVYL